MDWDSTLLRRRHEAPQTIYGFINLLKAVLCGGGLGLFPYCSRALPCTFVCLVGTKRSLPPNGSEAQMPTAALSRPAVSKARFTACVSCNRPRLTRGKCCVFRNAEPEAGENQNQAGEFVS